MQKCVICMCVTLCLSVERNPHCDFVIVSGVVVFSRRALPLAAWTNGLEIASVKADVDRWGMCVYVCVRVHVCACAYVCMAIKGMLGGAGLCWIAWAWAHMSSYRQAAGLT